MLLRMQPDRILIVGGGAAGFFAAITAAEADPAAQVVIRETSGEVLTKVRISGGGRCNVTHACFEPRELVAGYPRGTRELRGPFSRFQPADTVAWFAGRGIELKTEADGRMFPITDDSATIAGCLEDAARDAGVTVRTRAPVRSLRRDDDGFVTDDGERYAQVCLATGGTKGGHALARGLGHTITPLAPSLFTFVCRDPRLRDLAGVSVPGAELGLLVDDARFRQRGPLLVTHWGLSGPAVLKLSAFAARELAAAGYRAELRVAWTGEASVERIDTNLADIATAHPRQQVATHAQLALPKRLWQRLVETTGIEADRAWAQLSKAARRALAQQLADGRFAITGKGRFKEEFVTCGGVALDELDLKTMASKLCPGLFVIGEACDVDGITGGFNFQHAWTSGYLAGLALAS